MGVPPATDRGGGYESELWTGISLPVAVVTMQYGGAARYYLVLSLHGYL